MTGASEVFSLLCEFFCQWVLTRMPGCISCWNLLGWLVLFTSFLAEHEEVSLISWLILCLWLMSRRVYLRLPFPLESIFIVFLPFLNTQGVTGTVSSLHNCPIFLVSVLHLKTFATLFRSVQEAVIVLRLSCHLTRIWAVLSAPQGGDIKVMQYTGAMTYLLSHLSRSIALGQQ